MFEQERVITSLTSKVNDLIERYNELCKDNEELHNQIVTLKAQNEAKTNQISRLEDELNKKTNETDDVLAKIEAVLNK